MSSRRPKPPATSLADVTKVHKGAVVGHCPLKKQGAKDAVGKLTVPSKGIEPLDKTMGHKTDNRDPESSEKGRKRTHPQNSVQEKVRAGLAAKKEHEKTLEINVKKRKVNNRSKSSPAEDDDDVVFVYHLSYEKTAGPNRRVSLNGVGQPKSLAPFNPSQRRQERVKNNGQRASMATSLLKSRPLENKASLAIDDEVEFVREVKAPNARNDVSREDLAQNGKESVLPVDKRRTPDLTQPNIRPPVGKNTDDPSRQNTDCKVGSKENSNKSGQGAGASIAPNGERCASTGVNKNTSNLNPDLPKLLSETREEKARLFRGCERHTQRQIHSEGISPAKSSSLLPSREQVIPSGKALTKDEQVRCKQNPNVEKTSNHLPQLPLSLRHRKTWGLTALARQVHKTDSLDMAKKGVSIFLLSNGLKGQVKTPGNHDSSTAAVESINGLRMVRMVPHCARISDRHTENTTRAGHSNSDSLSRVKRFRSELPASVEKGTRDGVTKVRREELPNQKLSRERKDVMQAELMKDVGRLPCGGKSFHNVSRNDAKTNSRDKGGIRNTPLMTDYAADEINWAQMDRATYAARQELECGSLQALESNEAATGRFGLIKGAGSPSRNTVRRNEDGALQNVSKGPNSTSTEPNSRNKDRVSRKIPVSSLSAQDGEGGENAKKVISPCEAPKTLYGLPFIDLTHNWFEYLSQFLRLGFIMSHRYTSRLKAKSRMYDATLRFCCTRGKPSPAKCDATITFRRLTKQGEHGTTWEVYGRLAHSHAGYEHVDHKAVVDDWYKNPQLKDFLPESILVDLDNGKT